METQWNRTLRAIEHAVTRRLLALPPGLLAWVGRNVPQPEGVAPAPQVAAIAALAHSPLGPGLSGHAGVAAARATTERSSKLAASRKPDGVTQSDHMVAGADGPIDARLYVPATATDGRLMVYAHGGGWVVGSLDTHDGTCRFLARHAATRVLSVDYRLAPEHPFPAGVRDMQAALADIHANAARWGADPELISVAGDSAGGNLAAVLARRFDGGPRPCAALLIYPVCDAPDRHPSYELFAKKFVLERAEMQWFFEQYVPAGHDVFDPEISPLHGEIDADHPPTLVVTAGFDPLRDEAEAYAVRLQDTGVPTVLHRAADQIHTFSSSMGISSASHDEMAKVAGAFVALGQLHVKVPAPSA